MIDHIGLSVVDYERSKSFYTRALAPLSYEVIMEVSEVGPWAGLGAGGKPDFWIGKGEATTPRLHIAFRARDRATYARSTTRRSGPGPGTMDGPACARSTTRTTTVRS